MSVEEFYWSIGQFIGVGYLVRSWLLPWPVLGQWSCHVMCICLFVCLLSFVEWSSKGMFMDVEKSGWSSLLCDCFCVFVICFSYLVLLFVFVICFCYLVVCCHLLSGVACLWTWRNPGPHSCVNQSESEASFSVEKSATASIIRHLPPSLQIVLDFVYRNLTLLKK